MMRSPARRAGSSGRKGMRTIMARVIMAVARSAEMMRHFLGIRSAHTPPGMEMRN